MPSAMLKFVRGVQQRLRKLGSGVGLLAGFILAHPSRELRSVINNKFSLQQLLVRLNKSHYDLNIYDIRRLSTRIWNIESATVFRNRLFLQYL